MTTFKNPRHVRGLKIHGPLWTLLGLAIYNLGDKISQATPTTKTEWAAAILQSAASAIAIYFAFSDAKTSRPKEEK